MITPDEQAPDFRRLWVLYAIIFAFFGAIVVRLWFLQVVRVDEFTEMATGQRTRLIRQQGARGEIVDSRGRVLAGNRPHYVVKVLPDQIQKYPETLPRLVQLLGLDLAETQKKIKQNRLTPSDPVPIAEDIDLPTLTRFAEQGGEIPGVLLTSEPKRIYLDAQTCTHALGIVRPISAEKLEILRPKGYRGGDYIGMEGVEARYEESLRGKEGGQYVEVDARGRIKRTLREKPPTPGQKVRLTLDIEMQKLAYQLLYEQLAKGRTGAIVALDPNDGAVLTFASSPTYDLNSFGKSYGDLLKDERHPLYNRTIQMAHACGSPFKLITAAAGLATTSLSTGTSDFCPGYIMVGNRRFNCDKRSGHGGLGFYEAIAASCDVYFYHAGQKVGIENLAQWAKNFGFGAKTEIDLSAGAETAGLVPTPEWKHRRKRRGPWVLGDLVNLSIGQGFLGATPTQLAVMTAAFANGGDVLRPQLVREIVDVSQEKPVVVKRLQRSVLRKTGLSGEHLRAIVEGMKQVLREHGTAAGIQIPGLTVAGKTGSVEAVLGGKEETHSVFVCFAPAENPKIALAVYIEKGNWGAETAAPIARKLLMKFFNIGQETPVTPEAARTTRRRSRRRPSSKIQATDTAPPSNTPVQTPQTPAESPANSAEAPLKREENP